MFIRGVASVFKATRVIQKNVSHPIALNSSRFSGLRCYSGGTAPSKKEIEHRVMVLLKEFDKIDHAKLTTDSHFIKDLGLDSLDQVEITMALEEEFHIEIPDKDAEEIMSPSQAIDKIYSNKDAI